MSFIRADGAAAKTKLKNRLRNQSSMGLGVYKRLVREKGAWTL